MRPTYTYEVVAHDYGRQTIVSRHAGRAWAQEEVIALRKAEQRYHKIDRRRFTVRTVRDAAAESTT